MAEETFVQAEVWSVARTDQGNAVLVRPVGSEVAVPIFIGPLETQSIVIGLGGVKVPRPLTHDMILDLLRICGRSVERVEICDLKEGTYFARLVISAGGGEERWIDSRPSDALALAVRVKCPIYISEQVVDEAGVPIDLVARSDGVPERGEASLEDIPAMDGADADPAASERRALMESLERAVEEEDYERAAILRDRLRELDGEA
jgi:bifunctional DNase/RNase